MSLARHRREMLKLSLTSVGASKLMACRILFAAALLLAVAMPIRDAYAQRDPDGPNWWCQITPGGVGTATGCRSILPGFYFAASIHIARGLDSPTPIYTWQVNSIEGLPPTAFAGCGIYNGSCDFSLETTSSSDTVVDVQVTYPVASGPRTDVIRIRVPCTTVKTNNHPTLCN